MVAPELGRDEHVGVAAAGVAAWDVERLLPGVHIVVEPGDVAGRVALEVVVAILHRPEHYANRQKRRENHRAFAAGSRSR